eukprot:TRINITY_DN4370_c0_g1_i1.p1 TRINITY_DN4370_c0_g1~~TRINITY_DN4370_c0_g1_i1.p1  ORF type:complete len:272 (+),score=45.04 TRINITY_DN4370_c0_g1_i1:407-1222(+)
MAWTRSNTLIVLSFLFFAAQANAEASLYTNGSHLHLETEDENGTLTFNGHSIVMEEMHSALIERFESLESKVMELETNLSVARDAIVTLERNLSLAEDAITRLTTNLSLAQGMIMTLKTNLSLAEATLADSAAKNVERIHFKRVGDLHFNSTSPLNNITFESAIASLDHVQLAKPNASWANANFETVETINGKPIMQYANLENGFRQLTLRLEIQLNYCILLHSDDDFPRFASFAHEALASTVSHDVFRISWNAPNDMDRASFGFACAVLE